MSGNVLKQSIVGAGVAVMMTAATVSPAAAQGYSRYEQPASVVVQCAPGQRAVMEQARVNGTSQTIARCVGSSRQPVYDTYEQPVRYRTASDSYAPARRAPAYQETYRRQRSTSKTVLGIAGSAATGAGVGAIVGGKKGALIGAAIGGGGASIYEAAKRR